VKFERYTGTASYIASPELCQIVNVAISLRRPLLIRGEPGTGKTVLAESVASCLGVPLLRWHVKSTTKAREGLYTYDTVQRLNDSRFGDNDVSDISQYIHLGPLGEALKSSATTVLLIDEVDKADIEFPNDLLHELDNMEFTIPETGETIKAEERPIVIITSNAEKELPDAFLRRCVFHYISFPDGDNLEDIVRVHYPNLDEELLRACLLKFYHLRELPEVRKKPSTSELLDWVAALQAAGVAPEQIEEQIPFLGTLLKKEQDQELLQRRWRRGSR